MGKIVKLLKSYSRIIFQLIRTQLFFKWRFKKIGKRVRFGRMNRIRGAQYIEIGDYCHFGNNLRLEAVTRYGKGRFSPKINIGNNVVVNQNFHCTCAESIEIGEGTSITANCGIFDIIHPYEDISINPRMAEIEYKAVRIGKDCLIGMNAVILPGTQIGNHCVVGANSTVSGVFPDNCVIVGSPAKIVKQYDRKMNKWIKIK